MSAHEGAHVRGAKDERCVGQFVYEDLRQQYTLAADDRDGEPVAVVAKVVRACVCDLRSPHEDELRTWRRRNGVVERE